ncbi:MAG: hypothetical protein MZV70_39515 [Desulfobacterales bacterium]|nr:hypothetical protein [Desulfobacterales bacterium]
MTLRPTPNRRAHPAHRCIQRCVRTHPAPVFHFVMEAVNKYAVRPGRHSGESRNPVHLSGLSMDAGFRRHDGQNGLVQSFLRGPGRRHRAVPARPAHVITLPPFWPNPITARTCLPLPCIRPAPAGRALFAATILAGLGQPCRACSGRMTSGSNRKPSGPSPARGSGLRLYVGQNFAGESIPYFLRPFRALRQRRPGGRAADSGRARRRARRRHHAGHTRPLCHWPAHPAGEQVSLDGSEEFGQYLRKEGLERSTGPAPAALQAGPKGAGILFSLRQVADRRRIDRRRCHGPGTRPAARRPVAVTNPYRPGQSTRLKLQLLYQGKPLCRRAGDAVQQAPAAPRGSPPAPTRTGSRNSIPGPAGTWLATSAHAGAGTAVRHCGLEQPVGLAHLRIAAGRGGKIKSAPTGRFL